jgi:hypothetical protein
MSDVREEHALVIKRIDLGVAAENFLASDVCKHLSQEAEERRTAAVDDLIRCHPSNVDQNIALRLEIAKLETWREWIVGLYEDGQAARELLNQLEAETGGQEPPQ